MVNLKMNSENVKTNGTDDDNCDIVISGISGRFPRSDNMNEFAYNLYNKIDMIDDSEEHFRHVFVGHPKRFGKVRNLEKFDPQAFSVLHKSAHTFDPQGRILLEHAYEAIIDAGVSPKSLFGSNTGVFVGSFSMDSLETWVYNKLPREGLATGGNALFSLSNRMSFSLGFTGPSLTVDTACSSSLYALDLAMKSIRNGECDAALVAGTNLVLNPLVTEDFVRAGILAKDGIARVFDEDASGYIRADAMCVAFLQKKINSKRTYVTLVHCTTNNDGFKSEGPTFPSKTAQASLFAKLYKDLKMDPGLVDYVEAHATGTKIGDPQEVSAIDEIFCKNRSNPLRIGSVKSNIGHAEGAAGISSVAKAILIFENEKLAPNLNIKNIRSDCPAFTEGRLRVVEEVEEFKGQLIAVNSFGVFGANAHILLKGNNKKKVNNGIPQDDMPRLVTWSGRTEEAINAIFDEITTRPLDAEHIALLQSSQVQTSLINTFRGFGIFSKGNNHQNAVCLERNLYQFSESKRPVVWIFSGVGSQWNEMGSDLMKIPIIAEKINKCHETLAIKGLNLKDILTTKNEKVFEDVLNTFISIAAIQIALTDVLKATGMEPDYIVGHSVGELGCAYADGCLTAEDVILSAFSRGMACKETGRAAGAMAAIGMGFNELKDILPKGIEIACHNASDSCTVAGTVEGVAAFVEDMKSKNIFAKAVATSGMPFHSSYMECSGPRLLERLRKIIKNPRKRSSKWLSTSVPQTEWQYKEHQYCSAEYHTNNLLSPVLFDEVVTATLPKNAILIEIAPHGILQAILKRSFTEGVNIPLAKKDIKHGSMFLLNSLGRIFENGIDLDVSKLYPVIDFPVSRGTPMIGPHVKWDHKLNYNVAYFDPFTRCDKRNILISLSDPKYEYIKGHTIDGRVLFPATAYVCIVWESFGMMMGEQYQNVSVTFEELKFLRATTLLADDEIEMTVVIQRGSGKFEVTEGGATLISGIVKLSENGKFVDIEPNTVGDFPTLSSSAFYKELRLRGYQYYDKFKCVSEAKPDTLTGKVEWHSNWVTFIDGLLQIYIISQDTRKLLLPTFIRKITIDPAKHRSALEACGEKSLLDVVTSSIYKILQCGGVEICGMEANFVNRRHLTYSPVLEISKFVPHFPTPLMSRTDAAKFCIQLILENIPLKKVTTVEIDMNDGKDPLSEYFQHGLSDLPLVTSEINYLSEKNMDLENITVQNKGLQSFNNLNIVIRSGGLSDPEFLDTVQNSFEGNGFLVTREAKHTSSDFSKLPECFKCIACVTLSDELLFVIQYIKTQIPKPSRVVKIAAGSDDFKWIKDLKLYIKEGPVLIYSQTTDEFSGILGLFNCVRREPDGTHLQCVFIDDNLAPEFDINDPFYKSQIDLGLTVNVFKNNLWGSYKHLTLDHEAKMEPRTDHCFANCPIRGDLSSLEWINRPINPSSNSSLIQIHYSALNFRDSMCATGRISLDYEFANRISQQYVFGSEFSGIDSNGRRLAGIVKSKALATHFDFKSEIGAIFEIPDDWSLQDAATVPVVYFTVYEALFISTVIEKGKSILIHAGSGGFGLAAIRIALHYGLEVYTTVSTTEKRDFLLNEYPQLKKENIGNSRSTSFEQMVLKNTNGKGVDYVLNSLSEDKLQATIRCLGDRGVFLEIGKFDMLSKNKIDMSHFLRGITFQAVILRNGFDEFTVKIAGMLQRDIKAGIIKPLKTTVFDASEIEQAFRYLGSGKHIGKVVIKMRETEKSIESLPIKVRSAFYCNEEHSYVILGGLGGFGLELADWLVLRECKKLVLSSRQGVVNSYQAYRIKIWQSYGVNVVINTSDITSKSGCVKLVHDSLKLGPIGGIFNLAVVLKDSLFENQDEEMFRESLGPKALATKYLDEITRALCLDINQFVIFSSVSCGRGNAGQSNYGMANSIMERIVEQRNKDGLAGKAIQWGAIGEVGLVADMQESNVELEIGGTLQQRISSCLDVIDICLSSNEPITSSMVVAEKRFDSKGSKNIIEILMNVMGIRDLKSISMESALSDLGMDSLMGVEIQQLLERDFNVSMTSQKLRSLTLTELQQSVSSETSVAAEAILQNQTENSYMDLILQGFESEINSNDAIIDLNGIQNDTTKALIIPGIEGLAGQLWFNLAKNIKHSTYILQLLKTWNLESFNEIFNAIVGDALRVFEGVETFLLIGFSFGSMLALKLAHKLESLGKTGQVLIIDGSPNFMKRLAMTSIPSNSTDEFIQSMLLSGAVRKIFSSDIDKIERGIASQVSWKSKCDQFEAYYKAQNNGTGHHAAVNLQGFFNRMKITLNADQINFSVINSKVTLIKPFTTLQNIDSNYGLQKYTNKIVEIRCLDGDHLTILQNSQLLNIINSL